MDLTKLTTEQLKAELEKREAVPPVEWPRHISLVVTSSKDDRWETAESLGLSQEAQSRFSYHLLEVLVDIVAHESGAIDVKSFRYDGIIYSPNGHYEYLTEGTKP